MIDPLRVARAGVLLVWTTFFVYLRATGEITRYLGPRTYWVVTFGAVVLAASFLAQAAAVRSERPRRVSAATLVGLTVMVMPVVAVLAIPEATLGALAAGRKNAAVAGGAAGAVPDATGRDPSFSEIHFAGGNEEYARALGVTDGTSVSLTGFVTHPPEAPPGTYGLTRFYVSCCAADAIPYTVFVADGAARREDAWLEVTGVLERRGERFVVVPREVREVAPPSDPYLY
ncbi:MAG TPA: TIGR03943 family protein [Actinomycetota bacterium]|jgi:putative membrane protein|nr:TIGR03943 family protein [Actinomycetota bacterium]